MFKENAISLGLDSATSSWIFSGLGVGGFIGRIAGGHICDVVRSKFDDRKVVFVLITGKIFASIGKSNFLELVNYFSFHSNIFSWNPFKLFWSTIILCIVWFYVWKLLLQRCCLPENIFG